MSTGTSTRFPPPELPVPRRRSNPFPASNCQNTPPEERDRRRDAKTEREELYLSRIDALAQPHAAPIQIAATAACAFVVDMGEVGPGRKAATVLDVAVERGGHPEREQEGVGPAVEMQDNVGLR